MKSVGAVILIGFCASLCSSDSCGEVGRLLAKLDRRGISSRYFKLHNRCLSPHGFQPSCRRADDRKQAVAKINNKGSIPSVSGGDISFHLQGAISFQRLSRYETKIYAVFKGVSAFTDGRSGSEQFSLHVHQIGETNPSCSATGGHFNPCGKNHSDDPKAEDRHIGDVAKVTMEQGSDTLTIETIDTQVKLDGPLSVLGRSVTVHAGKDASRVGCATIALTEWDGSDRHPDTSTLLN